MIEENTEKYQLKLNALNLKIEKVLDKLDKLK
jgi:hypothetical protein